MLSYYNSAPFPSPVTPSPCRPTMNSSPYRLAIAGAGIGGLSAALAVHHAGAEADVFEKAPAFAEVGAGIQVGPNVWHCLQSWGLDASLRQYAAFPLAIEARSASSNRLLSRMALGDAIALKYGAPYATIHRADLHRLLLEKIRTETQCRIHLGTELSHYRTEGSHIVLSVPPESATGLSPARAALHEQEAATAHLQAAATVAAVTAPLKEAFYDGLIAADGVWSKLRQSVVNDGDAHATGHCAFRGLIRQSALPERMRTNIITTWLGADMHAVLYPIRAGEWLNMVVIFAMPALAAVQADAQSWSLNAPVEQLQRLLAHANPALQDMVQAISVHGTAHEGQPWRMWPLFARQPLQRPQEMASGRIALLGDAAHPMLPYLAQGAAMAIEDAWQLQQALAAQPPLAAGESGIPAAFAHYAQQRYKRNARVQAKALRNGRIFHLKGPMRAGRDLSLALAGAKLMDSPWLYRSITLGR